MSDVAQTSVMGPEAHGRSDTTDLTTRDEYVAEPTANDRTDGVTFPSGGGTTLARFDRPRGSATTLAVIADPHLTPTERGTFKMYHRTKQRLQMAIADAHRLDVDGVVVAGDLTRDGDRREFALAREILATAPEPTIAVPGNHDLTGGDPSPRAFAREYAGGQYPVTREIDSTTVTLLDSTRPDGRVQSEGGIEAESLIRLGSDSLPGPRIAVTHHPISPIPEPIDGVLPESKYRLREPERTADALREAGVELLISGHIHWPYAATYRGLRVVGAPSCASFPPAYLRLHVDSRGTTVSIVPLADEAGLTEAYEFAVSDSSRGDAIRAAVTEGYFTRFPMVDEQGDYRHDPRTTRTEFF
jgi:Icc protein